MKKIILISAFIFNISLAHAANPGFASGLSFKQLRLLGDIVVTCFPREGGGTKVVHARCRGDYLDPRETDYFVGPAGVEANQVALKANYPDGTSSGVKKSKYDGKEGKSKGKFNLWLASLTQEPLLRVGQNNISWVLVKGQKLVDRGDFYVNVEQTPIRECKETGNYLSHNEFDCVSPDFMCEQYFREYNYCE